MFVVVSAALFLTMLAFFAVIVFMPLFLQVVEGASATESGLLLLPMLLAGTPARPSPGARSPAPGATRCSRSPASA